MISTPEEAKRIKPTEEIGLTGLNVSHGYIDEEFLTELRGDRGRDVYREMRDNDATIGAFLCAIDTLVKAVDWRVDPSEMDTTGEYAAFLESCMDDMTHSWQDFISEVLTLLTFGWSYHEIVYKRRVGPLEQDGSRRSKYTDGKIGIRKLAPRAQESLHRWEIEEDGSIRGMYQQGPNTGKVCYIPIEKALLFRLSTVKNNPEGRSVLRNCYKSYYYIKKIQNFEAIAIERDLNGIPVVRIPKEILSASGDTALGRSRNIYLQIARDLKVNSQGGLVLPSETYPDENGRPSNVRMVDIELLSSNGTRTIDTDKVITRYQQDIARTCLADFLMLGNSSAGSFALAKDKSSLFLRSLEAILNSIASTLNRHLVPRLWQLNGFDLEVMPQFNYGEIAPVDLDALGNYVRNLSGAGVDLLDEETDDYLRDQAGLPRVNNEDKLL
jgi:hypothetical protein